VTPQERDELDAMAQRWYENPEMLALPTIELTQWLANRAAPSPSLPERAERRVVEIDAELLYQLRWLVEMLTMTMGPEGLRGWCKRLLAAFPPGSECDPRRGAHGFGGVESPPPEGGKEAMDNELLPCPFCGGPGFLNRPGSRVADFVPECRGGGCWATLGAYATEEEAITAWNRRAPPEGERSGG
jgi:hypothetical protein